MVCEMDRLRQINIGGIINEKVKTEAILRNIADGIVVASPPGAGRLQPAKSRKARIGESNKYDKRFCGIASPGNKQLMFGR